MSHQPQIETNPPGTTAAGAVATEVVAHAAEFAEVPAGTPSQSITGLDQLLDVKVTVTAELGRVQIPIGQVVQLGIGSVLELQRPVSDPVDLYVQGVLLARGEVVVVDDRFAIRIKEIARPRTNGTSA